MSRVSRFFNQWRERSLEREFDEELRFHLETRIEVNLRRGMSRAEAEAEARRHLGSPLRAREGMREARISGWLDGVVRDCWHGVRIFRRQRGPAALVVLMLSFGIGANAAIFTLLNAALVRPLPFADADRLITVQDGFPNANGRANPTIPELLDVRSWSRNLETLSFFDTRDAQINGGSEPARVFTARVESALLPMLGATPARGRLFGDNDGRQGSPFVALLTDGLWRRNFGGDPAVIGRSVIVNGLPHEIVGVLPPDFSLDYLTPEPIELYLPYPMVPTYTSRTAEFASIRRVAGIAKIKRGLSVSAASVELAALSRVLVNEHPALYRGGGANGQPGLFMDAAPLREAVSAPNRPALMLLMAVVVLVLLIACANTAQYLLARSIDREPEVAVRSALGAGRARLIRQFVSETSVLALAAAMLGLLQATWLTAMLRNLLPQLRVVGSVGVDTPVLVFTTAVALMTTAVCGVVPALRFCALHPAAGVESRATTSAGTRSRHVLIALEVAVSIVLLLGAGLLLQTLRHLQLSQRGFSVEGVTVMRLRGMNTGANVPLGSVYKQYLDRITAIPGLEAVAVTSAPLPGRPGSAFNVLGRVEDAAALSRQSASYQIVSPGYFSALRIPILEGRTFGDDDVNGRPAVAIVSQELARRAWPGQSALGKQIRAGDGPRSATLTIVGVAGNVRPIFQSGDEPQIYVSYLQQSEPSVALLVRALANGRVSAESIKQAIWSVEPRQALFSIQPMEELVSQAARSQRAITALLVSFALLALLLSVIGVYTVVTFLTSRRTKEIALRRAIGARGYDVLALLAGRTFRWALGGLAVGIVAAVIGSAALRAAVAGVVRLDVVTVALVSGMYLALVAVAMSVPALRACRLDPNAALKAE
jgi:putative ABC transport system permease protein